MNKSPDKTAQNAKNAAIVLAEVLVSVEKGIPIDVAYDLVFGSGSYAKISEAIHDAANGF